MRLLLDTHAFLWWITDAPELSNPARIAISETSNSVFISAASAWEIATKLRIGKLPSATRLVEDFPGTLQQNGFESLPIGADHALRAGLLPGTHKDPFDRMLIAQSQAENLTLVSNETIFDSYGVKRLW